MTAPEPGSRKVVRLLRWFSTGSDGDRSNSKPSTQIEQEPSPICAGSPLIISRIAVGQCAGSSRLRSGASSAAIKSP